MTIAAAASAAVDYCSLWLEGVWGHCCAAHDASALDIAAAVALGRCVAATGNVAMGLVMAIVVIVLGPVYLWIQRRRRLQSFPASHER